MLPLVTINLLVIKTYTNDYYVKVKNLPIRTNIRTITFMTLAYLLALRTVYKIHLALLKPLDNQTDYLNSIWHPFDTIGRINTSKKL